MGISDKIRRFLLGLWRKLKLAKRKEGRSKAMKGEIISVGTELLLGQIVNTNACYLSEKLANLGIDVYYTTTVGDNPSRLREVIALGWQRSDLVILTGGLGPTMDDLTRETLADFLGLELILDTSVLANLRCIFADRGREMTKNNIKQAYFPAGAQVLPNPNGTAAGMMLQREGRIVVLLPGPPFEMVPMFEKEVIPRLRSLLGKDQQVIKSRILKLYGIGESYLETVLQSLLENQGNPTLATLAKENEMHLRLTAKADLPQAAQELLAEMEGEIRRLVGKYIFAADDETMEEAVGKALLEKGKTISVAESCTGGLIGHRLTEVAGSSDYFRYGIVSYSNEAKQSLLGVEPQLISQYGAVSSQVAEAMAVGVRELGSTSLGLAVTGIAGPGGGSTDKPVGLVYVALATGGRTYVERNNLRGPRRVVKSRASQVALNFVRRYLQGYLEEIKEENG